MIIKNIKLVTNTALFAVLVLCLFSCNTDLYETYTEYSTGSVVSVAKPDFVNVIQGNGRLTFSLNINADPKIKKGYITWNSGNDKKTFDINRTVFQNQTVEVEIVAPEDSIEFTVYLEDAFGNKSVKTPYLATILGEDYRQSLLNRGIASVVKNTATLATITWNTNTNSLLVKTEITYTDSLGSVKTIIVNPSENSTAIPNFQSAGKFSYKTTYKASAYSSDVFVANSSEGTFPVK